MTKSLPRQFWLRAKALLTIMHSAEVLEDLRLKGQPPNLRLHKLQGDLRGYWSVTIGLPWTIIFKFESGHFKDVKIVNYQKG